MPGPYAHITLVNQLRQTGILESLMLPADAAGWMVMDIFRFCELGALSPDYPNLGGEAGAQWADAMHYRRTGELLRSAVGYVRDCREEVRPKLLAWLLGYCAHVVTDLTIHPVVLAKVGDYARNKRQHRICEMNQDAHVFGRMQLGEIRESDFFAASVRGCGTPENRYRLDRDIVNLWHSLFRDVFPEMYASNRPDIDAWHARFVELAEESNLFPLGNLITSGLGLPYPARDEVDRQYVDDLPAPVGTAMQYDDIFDQAAMHVAGFWQQVVGAVIGDAGEFLARIGEWDLDTGLDEGGRLVFWGNDRNFPDPLLKPPVSMQSRVPFDL